MKTLFVAAALVVHLGGLAVYASPIHSIVAYGDSYSDNGNLGRESNGPVIVVWGGHNDILVNGQDQGVINVLNIVRALQAAGAEHILVIGVMDLGLTPFGNSQPSASQQRLTAISDTFNSNLEKALPSGVTYIDITGILRNVVANPASYNLTNVTAGCSLTRACTNPDEYLFWDSFHPTAQMNTIFAADFAQAAQAVPEPAVIVLTGIGFALSILVLPNADLVLKAQTKHDIHERLTYKGCGGLVARNLAEQLRIF